MSELGGRRPVCRRFRVAAVACVLLAAARYPATAGPDGEAPLWPPEIRRIAPGAQTYERVPARPAEGAAEDDYPLQLKPGAAVRVVDSTGFVHEGVGYRLAAATPLPGNRICVAEGGTRWACGLRGRSLLRLLIVGKRLRCRSGGTAGAEVMVTCLSGGTDIAARIVAEGLALAAGGDAAYAQAQAEAISGRKGVWSAAGEAIPVEAGPARR